MKRLYSLNFFSRVLFLLITPVFFQYFAIGFIWHSIYWGVITAVLLIWGTFILLSPLLGRIGCGWFCFFGTVGDLASLHPFKKRPWTKPKRLTRILMLIVFFATAVTFYLLNQQRGMTHDFAVLPRFLELRFDKHYQIVWITDIAIAFLFGFFLERRWVCKNLCVVGSLYSVGAKYSRLLPVVNTDICTLCGKCEADCLVRIPILEEIKNNRGMVTNPECTLCGKCVDVCRMDAIKLKFIWNRKKERLKSVKMVD